MWKPGFQHPPYEADGSETPDRPTNPPSVETNIHATDQWYEVVGPGKYTIAQEIINRNEGALYSFVYGQRQAFRQNLTQFWSHRIELPYLIVRYTNNFGQEQIIFDVYPQNRNPSSAGGQAGVDLNADGYVAYVICQPGYPNSITVEGVTTNSICGPYSFYLNGTLLNTTPYAVQGPSEMYLCAFGTTALRSSSLQDVPIELSPFAQDKDYPLISLDAPFGGKIQAMAGPDGATLIPAHPDGLGYWWNNFVDVRNQAAWIQGFWAYPTPKVYEGIQFKDARKSPLNYKGQNFATMYPNPNQSFQEVLWVGCVFSEFYNRLKLRGVKKSWLYGPIQTPTILVNDKPMMFAAGQQNGGGSVEVDLGFDLTPTKDPSQSDDNCFVPWGQAVTSGSDSNGISQSQLAAMSNWDDDVAQINSEYAAGASPAVASACQSLIAIGDEILAYPFDDAHYFHGEITVEQIIQSYDWYGVTIPAYSIFVTNPSGSWSPASAVNGYNSLTSQYAQTYATIDSLVNPQNLVYPVKPFGLGSGPDPWVYRTLSVNDNDFTFGDWQGGGS